MTSDLSWRAYNQDEDHKVGETSLRNRQSQQGNSAVPANSLSHGTPSIAIHQSGPTISGDNHATDKATFEQGNSNQNQVNLYISTFGQDKRTTLDGIDYAEGAAWDDDDPNKESAFCVPGTRQQLLQQIQEWIKKPGPRGFWLEGLAGTGKSTVARTVAKELEKENCVASFFFRRNESRRDSPSYFVRTIMRQLAHHEHLALPLIKTWNSMGSGSKTLGREWHQRVREPILSRDSENYFNANRQPIILVIDAIDESRDITSSSYDMFDFLTNASNFEGLNIRLFVTARPQQPVETVNFPEVFFLHRIKDSVVESDLRKFFEERFNRGKNVQFPQAHQIEELARICTPLFITAKICYEFIAESNMPREEQYRTLMQYHKPAGRKELQEDSDADVYAAVDTMYLLVIQQALTQRTSRKKTRSVGDESLRKFRDIVGGLITLRESLSCEGLATLLSLPQSTVMHYLHSLRTVIDVPERGISPIHIFHQSFPDFLRDRGRVEKACEDDPKIDPAKIWLDAADGNSKLFYRCLTIMAGSVQRSGLCKDICGLGGPGFRAKDIPRTTLRDRIPEPLRYACKHWASHFTSSLHIRTNISRLWAFMKDHLLHWLEAMSCLGSFNHAIHQLDEIHQCLNDVSSSEGPEDLERGGRSVCCDLTQLRRLIADARRIVCQSKDGISQAPLQVYSSALLFAPEQFMVKRIFVHELPSWILGKPKMEDRWDASLFDFRGHESPVKSMQFCADGRRVASLGVDGALLVWELITGHILWGVSGVTCIDMYGPSGGKSLLVAGDVLGNVTVWPEMNKHRGVLLRTESGRQDKSSVDCVVLSSNGSYLAAVDGDGFTSVWNATDDFRGQPSVLYPNPSWPQYIYPWEHQFGIKMSRKDGEERLIAVFLRFINRWTGGERSIKIWRCSSDAGWFVHHEFCFKAVSIADVTMIGCTLICLSESPDELWAWDIRSKCLIWKTDTRHCQWTTPPLVALHLLNSVLAPDETGSLRRYDLSTPIEDSVVFQGSQNVRKWTVTSNEDVLTELEDLYFSPDASILGALNSISICLFDCEQLRQEWEDRQTGMLPPIDARERTQATEVIIGGPALSPNGQFVAIASHDVQTRSAIVRIWRAHHVVPITVISYDSSRFGQSSPSLDLIFSPSGRWLATILTALSANIVQLDLLCVDRHFSSSPESTVEYQGGSFGAQTAAFSEDSALFCLCTHISFTIIQIAYVKLGSDGYGHFQDPRRCAIPWEKRFLAVVSFGPTGLYIALDQGRLLFLYKTGNFDTPPVFYTAIDNSTKDTRQFTFSYLRGVFAMFHEYSDPLTHWTVCTFVDIRIGERSSQPEDYAVPSLRSDTSIRFCVEGHCFVSNHYGVLRLPQRQSQQEECSCALLPVSSRHEDPWVYWRDKAFLYMPKSLWKCLHLATDGTCTMMIWDHARHIPLWITIDHREIERLVVDQSQEYKAVVSYNRPKLR